MSCWSKTHGYISFDTIFQTSKHHHFESWPHYYLIIEIYIPQISIDIWIWPKLVHWWLAVGCSSQLANAYGNWLQLANWTTFLFVCQLAYVSMKNVFWYRLHRIRCMASFANTGRVEDHSGEITVMLILLPVAAFVALLWFFGMYFSVKTRSPLFETSKQIV